MVYLDYDLGCVRCFNDETKLLKWFLEIANVWCCLVDIFVFVKRPSKFSSYFKQFRVKAIGCCNNLSPLIFNWCLYFDLVALWMRILNKV
jgi:hypothetical protein